MAHKSASKTLVVLDVGLSGPTAGLSFKEIISRGEIITLPVEGQKATPIFSDTQFVALPDGVVYSEQTQRLYYTNMGVPPLNDGSVCSVRLDGTGAQPVLAPGQIHTPKQLALDSKNNKLYISDREGLRVMRCNLDGSALETLVQTGDFKNAQDAHDYTKWCKGPSKGNQGRIFCAPMEASGSREPVCVLDNLPEPIDLDIDEKTNTLYWTDRGEIPYGNTFNRIQLDVSGTRPAAEHPDAKTGLRHEILVQNFDEAIGLARDADTGRWFVSDMGGTVWAFEADGKNKTRIYEDKDRAFTGIVLARTWN
ncbi:3-hydroxyacyl-CoA dehydrogenase-like protein LAM1 [Hirsutella rhossiliensis]|uniref:3-hydroxyacyl-CoA dehydrogenase-like protein LAM1 n=1 Tax=Hirsutella rhossiliensis TaxID=111463 RepID=A0A9P8MP20_9HYPO|nr:3-hydroxyacyl-CoA dehydrogenase-like protein LAM1 [Hirsutella rhossiliensis]KAH0958660.1 3-hydroxyacyl-CoA dehydrogenase-like protein LAM1 [Hirsutella rhossiliensis]